MIPAGCPLSARQFTILEAVSRGLSYKQAAQDVGVSTSTVRTHVHGALSKLGVSDCKQAIARMFREGWLDAGLPTLDQDYGPESVTAAQRLYLDAFDRHLKAPASEKVRTRAEMRLMLHAMRVERQQPFVPARLDGVDPLDWLLRALLR